MDFHLDNLLNFPQITVLSCQQKEEFIFLKLELLNEGIVCPHWFAKTEPATSALRVDDSKWDYLKEKHNL